MLISFFSTVSINVYHLFSFNWNLFLYKKRDTTPAIILKRFNHLHKEEKAFDKKCDQEKRTQSRKTWPSLTKPDTSSRLSLDFLSCWSWTQYSKASHRKWWNYQVQRIHSGKGGTCAPALVPWIRFLKDILVWWAFATISGIPLSRNCQMVSIHAMNTWSDSLNPPATTSWSCPFIHPSVLCQTPNKPLQVGNTPPAGQFEVLTAIAHPHLYLPFLSGDFSWIITLLFLQFNKFYLVISFSDTYTFWIPSLLLFFLSTFV